MHACTHPFHQILDISILCQEKEELDNYSNLYALVEYFYVHVPTTL